MEEKSSIQNNPLASAPLGGVIAKYAIPCVISLVVNGLYNIVDQIFIGNGVGYLGNSATNVMFPLTIFCVALGTLFGDGVATYLNLKLGQGDAGAAKKGIANGILLSIAAGIILCAVSLIFLKPIVYLFGCTPTVEPYALGYGFIVAIGFPFVLIATAVNSIIRADGSPKIAMISLVSGAVFNTIADPIFIFVFKMGVEGAALATIMGQILAFIISMRYMKKWKSIKFTKGDFKFSLAYCKEILPLGVASFINQMATVIMTAAINNMLTAYGAASPYGTDIPLAAMGITLKVNQIFLFVIIGIGTGATPVISFNYGAKNYKRVLDAFKLSVILSLIVSVIAFAVFQLAPMQIVSLFGAESDLYNEFAVSTFRIFLLLFICNGFQTTACIFIQAIEKPIQAAVLSLSRQIVFLVPAVILLPKWLGFSGVLWAGPVADALAFILAFIIISKTVINIKSKR